MKIKFAKISDAGFALKICDRHWVIGADDLLVLESSTRASYRMMYYNAVKLKGPAQITFTEV